MEAGGGLADKAQHSVTRSIQAVLETIAEAVVDQTSFRRVVVILFSQPITPGKGESAAVRSCAIRGLTGPEEARLREYLAAGGEVPSKIFSPPFRIGGSYLINQKEAHPELWRRIESRRRYFPPAKWRNEYLLAIPLSTRAGFIGTILMDDPRDGAEPRENTLRTLENLARVAVLALADADRLENPADGEELYRAIVENCMVGFFVTAANRIVYANSKAIELFGYPREELYQLYPWWQVIHPEDRGFVREEAESINPKGQRVRGFRKDGSCFWLLVRTYSMEYGTQRAYFADLWDITEQVTLEQMLRERAMRDPLTGLFNRQYFEESIHTELRRSQRYGRPLTLVLADLRGFKRVNDRFGHAKGDEVLRGIAQTIRETLRGSDWVIRYGGDEFLLVLPETAGPVDALVMRLRSAIENWNRKNFPEIPITIDIGWATWTPEKPRSVPELLAEADACLYEEKRKSLVEPS